VALLDNMTLIASISGIRGTLGGKPGDSLTPLDVVKYACAYGAWLLESKAAPKVVIGRDARPSGPMISGLVRETLRMMGISVVELGLSTTPTVEMAVVFEEAGGGIILTASHNPGNWNALKLLNHKGEFISAEDGRRILALAEQADFPFVESKKMGTLTEDTTALQKHIGAILALPEVDVQAIAARKFKIMVDGVNSSGGIAVPMLLEALGVEEITKLYLTVLSSEMKKANYDLGIVVDPDVDRLVFVNEDGSMFGEEYTLVAVADYVLSFNPGNTVSNLSSTRALQDVTEKVNGTYYAAAVGEVNVVAKMKEKGAVIGGEGNGGVIYPKLHYGRDALVGIALFLTHLAKKKVSARRLRSTYTNYHISKNKIELTPETDVDKILEKVKAKYAKQPINTLDGVRIEFDSQWVHLRKSNTEPIIRIYAEADSRTTADALAGKIIGDIKEILQ
jgi:phosphomannomutase